MSEKEINKEIVELKRCFLCEQLFEDGDEVIEFFGGLAHFDCFDKKMKENKKRREKD